MSAGAALGLLDFRPDVAERLLVEFEAGIDPRLRAALFEAAHECNRRGWPRPMLTCLWRSEAEEVAAGAKSRTHKDGRAADLSVRPFAAAGVDPAAFRDYLNAAFGVKVQPTAYMHDAGTGLHVHVQVVRRALVGATWEPERPAEV